MIATLIALLAAAILFFDFIPTSTGAGGSSLLDSTGYGAYLVVVSFLFLAIALFAVMYIWQVIWQTQEKKIACAQEFFRCDRWFSIYFAVLFLFCLFSLSLIVLPQSSLINIQLCIWIVFFGISLDVLRAHLKRLFSYTMYSCVIDHLSKALPKAVRQQNETQAVEWIGVAIDSALKSMQHGKIAHVSRSFASMHQLIETYVKELARMQSLAPAELPESPTPSFSDKINFLSVYVCERLQWLYENAIRLHVDPVAEEVLSEFAKLALYFSHHNERVAIVAVSFIAKSALASKNENSLIRAGLILSELCKAVLVESKARNESLLDLFMDALDAMEQIAKELYRKNKGINPVLLMQPFAEIAQLLGQDSMKQVHGRDEILKEIKRILTSFQSLELVVQNLEEVTGIGEDTTSTYRQDLPYQST